MSNCPNYKFVIFSEASPQSNGAVACAVTLQASVLWKIGLPMHCSAVSADTAQLAIARPLVMQNSVICATTENIQAPKVDRVVLRLVLVSTESTSSGSLQAAPDVITIADPDLQQLLQSQVHKSAIYQMMVLADCQETWEPEL